jgi:hypothetical protein
MECRSKTDSLGMFSLVSYIAIILYFLDIILLGSGQLTKLGVFSTRTLFFAVAFLAAVPLMLHRFRELVRNPFLIAVAAYFLWLAFALAMGLKNGNSRTIIKTDALGYLNFAILPAMLCVLDRRERVEQLMKIIAFASIAVAAATVAVSFFMFYPDPTALYRTLSSIGLCAITKMTKYSVRVFFHTGGRYCLVGFVFAFYFALRARADKRLRLLWTAGMALLGVAIFLSYSRAQYLGSLLAVLGFIWLVTRLERNVSREVWHRLLCSMAAVVVILTGLSVLQHADMFKTAYYRVVISMPIPNNDLDDVKKAAGDYMNVDQEIDSINVRSIKISMLNESIAKSPVIGNGLGAAINYDDGYVEYSYYDILNKMGVIGLCIFLSPFALMIVFLRRRRKRGAAPSSADRICYAVFAAIFYFLFIAYFNPSMNTTVGISCYAFGMAAFSLCADRGAEAAAAEAVPAPEARAAEPDQAD